jgi:hypothetical protein
MIDLPQLTRAHIRPVLDADVPPRTYPSSLPLLNAGRKSIIMMPRELRQHLLDCHEWNKRYPEHIAGMRTVIVRTLRSYQTRLTRREPV